MAEPTLEQMIQAADQRKAMPQQGFFDLLTRLLFSRQPSGTQMPRFDANGNPLPAQTLPDIMRK